MVDVFWKGYMITASQVRVNWDRITRNCKENTAKGATRENALCISHIFEVGQQVLVKLDPNNHKWKLFTPFEGPWQYSWGECHSQMDEDIKRFLPGFNF